MATVLGVSCFYHDSAAALVRDGDIVAAAQEERFSRQKHDPGFPRNAINYCLEEAFLEPEQLAAIVFYDNPVLTCDRAIKSIISVVPRGEDQWVAAAPSFLGDKLAVSQHIRRELGPANVPIFFTRHHLAHAASAFYPSPFEDAAILTLDGVGEWATTSIARGHGAEIVMLKEIHYPHSLGLLYSAFTYYCGFRVNSGEYKLMGLAPYGEPRYVNDIRDSLLFMKSDGSFMLDTSYFGYLDSNVATNDRFHSLFGGPPRSPEASITRREMDLAASIQTVIEEAVLSLAYHARELTGLKNLCLAGGVALNCVANGLLAREQVFERIWVQPAAGDAGGSLGAALLGSHRLFGAPRRLRGDGADAMKGAYLGPAFSGAEVRAFLDAHEYPYEVVSDPQQRADRIAAALAEGEVVGYFSGRMEFGPRALGARSILADPRRAETQVHLNRKIKFRESFRPFAPAILEERTAEWFELAQSSPYMLLVAPVIAERRRQMDWSEFDAGSDDLLPLVSQPRSDVPAVTHVDYSARVQTVNRHDHPDFRKVIESFERITGCPVVVNTSFNVRGEPIVCSPHDAYRCFARTEIDMLVLEDCVLRKDAQPVFALRGSLNGELD